MFCNFISYYVNFLNKILASILLLMVFFLMIVCISRLGEIRRIYCFNFMDIGDLGFNLVFLVDEFSLYFCIVVSLISGVVMGYSIFYMGIIISNRFVFILLLFILSMIMLIFGGNFYSIILGWDRLGVVSFLLVIYYQNEISIRRGLITIFINRLGDVAMVFFICFFLKFGRSFCFLEIFSRFEFSVGFTFFLLGCFTKRAQFPFMS